MAFTLEHCLRSRQDFPALVRNPGLAFLDGPGGVQVPRVVIDAIADLGSFVEIKKLFAREILTGFARIDGMTVGIVANQPKWLGGVLFVAIAVTRLLAPTPRA